MRPKFASGAMFIQNRQRRCGLSPLGGYLVDDSARLPNQFRQRNHRKRHGRDSRRDSTTLGRTQTNRRSRRTAWATLQRLRKFLEANGARINLPADRNFETEGEAIESGLRRTVEGRDMVMRSLIRAIYRFRDATLVVEKKDDFGNALQNLYRELERAEDLVGPG
jgi:hypothetical protein